MTRFEIVKDLVLNNGTLTLTQAKALLGFNPAFFLGLTGRESFTLSQVQLRYIWYDPMEYIHTIKPRDIYIAARGNGWTREQVHGLLQLEYGLSSTKDLTQEQAEVVVRHVKTHAPGEIISQMKLALPVGL